MTRIVTEFTEQAHFMVLCDHQNCSVVATAQISALTTPDQLFPQFLESCMKSGWTVTILGQLCPGHTRKVQNLVQMPSSGLIV